MIFLAVGEIWFGKGRLKSDHLRAVVRHTIVIFTFLFDVNITFFELLTDLQLMLIMNTINIPIILCNIIQSYNM